MISASGVPEAVVGSFSLASSEILASNISLQLVTVSLLVEYNPNIRGRGMMLVLPDQRFSSEFSMSVLCFLSCLPV